MNSTERLVLQIPEKEDFLRFYEINSDPQTNIYNPKGVIDYHTAEIVYQEMLNHWKINGFGVWKIAEKDSPDYSIGFGGLTNRKYGEQIKLNLGFRFDTSFWGKGYATEFANKAIEYGFDKLNKKEIFGLVRPKNLASIRVLKKSGLKLFSTLDDVPDQEESLVFRIQK